MLHPVSQRIKQKKKKSVQLPFFVQVSPLTGYSLMSGAGFVIALGVLIIILSITGEKISLKKKETK